VSHPDTDILDALFTREHEVRESLSSIDIVNDLPQFAVITDGRTYEVRVGREVVGAPLKKGDTVIFDRGYIDYGWMNEPNQAGITFVTRAKANCHFKVAESHEHDRTRGLRADQTVYLDSQRGSRYQGPLRRVSYREPPDIGRWLVFLTNNFDLAAMTIARLYEARWDVELFFKTIKQNLRVKKFLGTSVNAVKSQISVARIAYLLVQMMRFSLKTSISITDAVAVIGTLLLL